ncbi:hypothetical protein N7517_003992 [Penicillium concentricum]|uniref:Uncharacterized protein n=1 Tax=Penicillium concentricum TaxID=293559 RepID=A0A9W9S4R5_9EURO|nr:uncharacterized protein N7517_003992 [Penicillium concentricum]KAJ5371986.1 hypothetical protein N7517_003992 [Penicillium concentricum]
MSSTQASALGEWIDQLLKTVFFQSDDELSSKAIQESFSPNLKVRINGASMNYHDYIQAVAATRAQNVLSVLSNEELLSSCEGQDSPGAGGSVAHISSFVLKDRQTGLERKESTVTLATVGLTNGKRILVELTEVHRSA